MTGADRPRPDAGRWRDAWHAVAVSVALFLIMAAPSSAARPAPARYDTPRATVAPYIGNEPRMPTNGSSRE